mmetsp:Transcript_36311/g.84840  ORF Transcript_36311/g.84840 Transcript_36311/m.84840 type:complete len:202 (-) Transcript_36311:134-739(-)
MPEVPWHTASPARSQPAFVGLAVGAWRPPVRARVVVLRHRIHPNMKPRDAAAFRVEPRGLVAALRERLRQRRPHQRPERGLLRRGRIAHERGDVSIVLVRALGAWRHELGVAAEVREGGRCGGSGAMQMGAEGLGIRRLEAARAHDHELKRPVLHLVHDRRALPEERRVRRGGQHRREELRERVVGRPERDDLRPCQPTVC